MGGLYPSIVRAADYPYLISLDVDRGQRAERINDLIQSDSDGVTLEDMVAIQTDTYSVSAGEVLPYLEELPFDDPAVEAARDTLLTWDLQMHW